MNNSTQKSIKRLSIATLVIGGITLAYLYWEMIAQLWVDSYIYPLTWNPDIKGWQIFILVARFVGLTALFVLCCIFLHRTNKGLKDGEIFPKSNISLIRWTALVAALLAFVSSNYPAVVKGESEMMLESNTILIPLIVLLFAGLYKMAYLAAQDSKLAI
jgi:heme/copper-type cytochrome/quinol oxidase subunit 2